MADPRRHAVPSLGWIVAFALVTIVPRVRAEPTGSYFHLAPFGGYTIFDPDYHFPFTTALKDGANVGGRLGYQWRPWLGLELAGGFTGTREDEPGGTSVDWLHGSFGLVLSPPGMRTFAPFLLLGGGASRAKFSDDGGSDEHGNAEIGAGARLWITDRLGIRLEARDVLHLPKDDIASPSDQTWVFGGGLEFSLNGRPRDTDADGVPDRYDQCPGTTPGARVASTGCPLDSDGDAVVDGIDQCPDTPKGALVDTRGCTVDADGDSIPDGIDQCQGTPKGAVVDAKGCPLDSDGDGIADGLDQCAGTAAGAEVDARGCPSDSDRDGVWDGLDKCPGTAAGVRVDASGCPMEAVEREEELLDTGMIRLRGVTFETGSAVLAAGSTAPLDVAGQVLAKWPELRIEIGGHTDSRGSNTANRRLSLARVHSVLDYLLERFPTLRRDRFTLVGYGESRPIAPNTSEAGMARNRRVELKVLNRDVLRRVTERRIQPQSVPADTTRK